MYNPSHFQEARLPVLHAAIEKTGLATLITLGDAGLDASHIPIILEPNEGEYGTLYGHIARANSQSLTSGQALAIFLGPNAYISPSWYPSKVNDGKAVPTWNYITVHAHGNIQFFDGKAELLDIVTKLTVKHEAGLDHPWAVSDAPADYTQAMLKGIIGFKLSIARLEGKWKISQNRSDNDRKGVINGLEKENGPDNEIAQAII